MSNEIPRNQSCPCGSGHKYKKCCGRKEKVMENQKTVPSNDFRKELEAESVPDEELMLRDQRIMARAMQANHAQAGFRREMLEKSRIELASLFMFMQDQPYSAGLSNLLESVKIQHEACVELCEQPDVSRADLVQLVALEMAIAIRSQDVVVQESIVSDIKSPIDDDGLPKSNELDDDIEEEEHEMVDPGAKSVKVQ